MTSRGRSRGTSNQDADEERRLWKEIKDKARELDAMVTRSNEIGTEIIDVESQQAALIDAGKLPSAALDERLEKLYRENVKICEEFQHISEGQSNGMNLLDSIKVLAGLREASEGDLAAAQMQASQSQTGRTANGKLARPKKGANAKAAPSAVTVATNSAVEETEHEVSAAPSPKIILGSAASRLNAKDKGSRAASVSLSATREASVKVEDGAESVASSTDAPSTTTGGATGSKASNSANRPSNRLVLRMGEIVFCRHDARNVKPGGEPLEGEGILCRVTNVIGEGKQRRYEVQDADTSSPEPATPYRASVAQLIQIPASNKGLSDLTKGKSVLAQYPDTTTFYKAEVSEPWKGVKLGADAEPGLVILQFQDDEAHRDVERRFVLTEK
ncbi:hypothetical protein BAUCODRAFT_120662 [Baudoinia panamericana UAMH 10762]|uniref:SGF29 C-terminal domain-containing protein n=1 Tax=Baudoinia panamericana (strain UAMH 10762) TaxID=717646 RepID=M2LXH5_BAUPA|nr:uncharacterized protein BAUCODRAFT_120662 [Baudoinia panamericana UAMH 10762]EMC99402.1 hypothetical protein BAUCODRAFT_120662 [Baudoinia panamericana UAMH 10762]